MRTSLAVAMAVLAGGLLLAPIGAEQAKAAHGFGGGGMMGGGHFGGMGGGHFGGGMGGPRFAGGGHIGGPGGWQGGHFASRSVGPGAWRGGPRYGWNGRNGWNGNWHGHDHNHFVHDRFHNRFNNNVFIAGIGWWPGYYGYGYGYGGCGWLYRQAAYTGSPYWWDRYYACTGSYY